MKIKLALSEKGIEQAIKEYENWQKTLETRIEQFVKRLSEMGAKVAKIRFTAAVYDGDMGDITVQVEQHGKKPRFTPPGRPFALLSLAQALHLQSIQAGCMRMAHTAMGKVQTRMDGFMMAFPDQRHSLCITAMASKSPAFGGQRATRPHVPCGRARPRWLQV